MYPTFSQLHMDILHAEREVKEGLAHADKVIYSAFCSSYFNGSMSKEIHSFELIEFNVTAPLSFVSTTCCTETHTHSPQPCLYCSPRLALVQTGRITSVIKVNNSITSDRLYVWVCERPCDVLQFD